MDYVFTVSGMSCGHCEKAVTQAINHVDPLAQVQIDRAAKRVQVHSTQTANRLAQAIEEQGYPVTLPG